MTDTKEKKADIQGQALQNVQNFQTEELRKANSKIRGYQNQKKLKLK